MRARFILAACVAPGQIALTASPHSLQYFANNLPLFCVSLKALKKWVEGKGKKGVDEGTRPLPTLSPKSYSYFRLVHVPPLAANPSSTHQLETFEIGINSTHIQNQNLNEANVYLAELVLDALGYADKICQ